MIAALALATNIPPAALLEETPEMVATLAENSRVNANAKPANVHV